MSTTERPAQTSIAQALNSRTLIERQRKERAMLLGTAARLATMDYRDTHQEIELAGYLDDIARIDAQLEALEKLNPKVEVGNEPGPYHRGARHSWLRDLASVEGNPIAIGHDEKGVREARDRLERHARQVELDTEKERRFQSELAARGGAFETRVNPNRTLGQGGYLVPPAWLVDAARVAPLPGSPIANLVGASGARFPMPAGVQSTNIARITTAPTVTSSTDNSAVSDTDLTDAVSTSVVTTMSGREDVSLQMLENSPDMTLDRTLVRSFEADYATTLENQLVNGTGSGGYVRGILNVSIPGGNQITYTDASPAAYKLWTPFGQAFSNLASNRGRPPEIFYMAPRRWAWLAAGLDSQNRPLFPPGTGTTWHPGDAMGDTAALGPIVNVPVFINASIPLTQGAGSNQDVILALKPSDCVLFESDPVVRVLPEVLSGTLMVRFEWYRYVAWHADLYPSAIATITGTGLVGPAGF